MIKRPFLTFIFAVGLLVLTAMWFIQSPGFAAILKTVASRYLPKDLGVEADFSELSIKFYPPGFSVRNPKISLKSRNILHLPAGSTVNARSIDFTFHPFQALSGSIRIHEVTIIDGKIELFLDQGAPKPVGDKTTQGKASKLDLHWDELLNIRAESIGLVNTDFVIQFNGTQETLQAHAVNLRLGQWSGKGGLGYSANVALEHIQGSFLQSLGISIPLEQLEAVAYVNALGLQIETLTLKDQGLTISAEGEVTGNLLEPKGLKADLNLTLNGDLVKILQWADLAGKKTKADLPEGTVSFTGNVQGNPQRLMQTAQASGTVTIKNASYRKWSAEQIQAIAKWEAAPSGGVLSLVKATIQSEQRPRIGGKQAGGGGKLEIGPMKWSVGSTSPLSVPLSFQGAHIHWLGAVALKDVYPLDFRLNGPITVTVIPPAKNQPWEVRAALAAWVDHFSLDNQRLGQVKPQKTIFKVPRITLDGLVRVDSVGIHPLNLQVGLAHSKLVTNGKIDFKKGYDLLANGAMDLADLGQISENEIKGKGQLSAHIHGPSSRVFVDVDVEVKEAYYLNLFLGDLKGRITWDDDPQYLIFEKVKATRETTLYGADGVLKLGKENSADLNVRIPQGNIHDFIQIFQHLTHPLWWFPKTLTGSFSGVLRVSGGISLSELEITSQLSGTNWDWMGERFKAVYLSGGYIRGGYSVEDFRVLKRSSRITGNIGYGADGHLDWKVESQGLQLVDFDHISKLDVPMRGGLKFTTAGQGFAGAIKSSSQIALNDFSIRGVGMPPSQAKLETSSGIAKLNASVLGGEGTLDAVYDFNPREKSKIEAEFRQLDFSPILLLLNPRSIQDKALAGIFSGSADLTFHAGKFERANGSIGVDEYVLARNDTRFTLDRAVSSKVTDGSFALSNLTLKGPEGELKADLRGHNGEIEGTLGGDLHLSILEFFVSSITQASGLAHVNLSIGGSLKDPTFSGRSTLEAGALRVSSLESPFENISGTLTLRKNLVGVQKLEADVGGGRITTDGRVVLYPDRYPALFLESQLNGPKIKIFPFQYAKVHGNVEVQGEGPPYQVDGQVQVESALTREKVFSRRYSGQGLKVVQYSPPPTRQTETNFSKFNLNLNVTAQKGIFIQNDLFRDVELKCNLKVVNTLETPVILGRADVISGKLLFKDHVFQIQSAAANFDSPTSIDPSLDLNASTEVNHIKIQMFASGRQDKLKIELTSNPAMQEGEILSLLAVGLTSSDARKLNATDLSAVQQGEAASLLLHSLDFNRDLEDKTGFQVKLDETLNPSQGVSIFRPQGDSVAAPQITIRRKLGERVSLSAGSTVGVGTNKANQVNLDFLVNKDVSITGSYINYGTYGTSDSQTILPSFGLDLKFQKRFK